MAASQVFSVEWRPCSWSAFAFIMQQGLCRSTQSQQQQKPRSKQLNYSEITLIVLRNLHHHLGAAMLFRLFPCLSFTFNHECPGTITVHLWWIKMVKTIHVNKRNKNSLTDGIVTRVKQVKTSKSKTFFSQSCTWEVINIWIFERIRWLFFIYFYNWYT